MSYEGLVKFADGSVISIQCFDGRCGECPDVVHTPDGDVNDGAGPTLDGKYCEHGCDGVSKTEAEREGDRNEREFGTRDVNRGELDYLPAEQHDMAAFGRVVEDESTTCNCRGPGLGCLREPRSEGVVVGRRLGDFGMETDAYGRALDEATAARVAQGNVPVVGKRTETDAGALNRIQRILRDPEWGSGMLEDIGEIIVATGRSIDDLLDEEGEPISTWGRH